jgi:DNA invertase Pin-like site-specific DNA recombinase
MAGQRVGYVRVSTLDQRTDRQLDGVELDRVFTDKASGKDVVRPQLDALLAFVRDGDTVVVHSMDRLARNLDDLRRLVRAFTGKGVRVQFVTENLTFTGEDTAMATLLLSVMGAFAEFERALIRERQREGIAQARLRGAYRGRKTVPDDPTGRRTPAPRTRRRVENVAGQGLRDQPGDGLSVSSQRRGAAVEGDLIRHPAPCRARAATTC